MVLKAYIFFCIRLLKSQFSPHYATFHLIIFALDVSGIHDLLHRMLLNLDLVQGQGLGQGPDPDPGQGQGAGPRPEVEGGIC